MDLIFPRLCLVVSAQVARVVAHRQITTIAEIREGLEFPKPHKFQDNATYFDDTLSTSGNKRKSLSNNMSDNTSGSKRRYLYTPGEGLWENKIYSCLVVPPASRIISDFKTTKELLELMRDAIKAHQSLYITGKIIHCNISPNNIIITELEWRREDSGLNGARHRTGTTQFMAVGTCAHQAWKNGLGVGSYHEIITGPLMDKEFPEALEVVKTLCWGIRSILFGPLGILTEETLSGDLNQLYTPIIAAYDETIY
ncbi:hypothetical protein F4802DRAFT_610528 [Xylaria palmicola]|nr:hypothetical protein F4802DRAFT_610528 [Xylaria palmicola]